MCKWPHFEGDCGENDLQLSSAFTFISLSAQNVWIFLIVRTEGRNSFNKKKSNFGGGGGYFTVLISTTELYNFEIENNRTFDQ